MALRPLRQPSMRPDVGVRGSSDCANRGVGRRRLEHDARGDVWHDAGVCEHLGRAASGRAVRVPGRGRRACRCRRVEAGHRRRRRRSDGPAARVSRLLHRVLPPRLGERRLRGHDVGDGGEQRIPERRRPADRSGVEHAVPGEHPVAMDGGARRAPSALLVFLPSHRRLRQPADGSWPRPRVRGRDGVDGGDSQLAGVLVCAARHRPGEDARAEGVDPHRRHGARVRRAPARPPDAGRGCRRPRLSVPSARSDRA